MNLKKIAIIGRPNVGKSAIFNLLTSTRNAIVSDMPGMTRDRNLGVGNLLGLRFNIIDTAGVDVASRDQMALLMNKQSFNAVCEADVVLFVIDSSAVIHEEMEIADWLRKTMAKVGQRPVLLIANKSDNKRYANHEFFSLGFGDPIYMSAKHKLGLDGLYYQLTDLIEPLDDITTPEDAVRVAVLGRPNVGKSTLFNCILGEERAITSDVAGTTRDAISSFITHDGVRIELIDTAGSRKNKSANSYAESLSVKITGASVAKAHVVVLVVDASSPFDVRDLQLANHVIDEGRALIIALNKCDLIKRNEWNSFVENCKQKLGRKLSESYNVVRISAIKNQNVDELLDAVIASYQEWNTFVSVNALNNWIRKAVTARPPSTIDKRCPKLSFIKQVSSRPPSFVVFGTKVSVIEKSYIRYLENSLRREFALPYTPVRISVKQKDNPFKVRGQSHKEGNLKRKA